MTNICINPNIEHKFFIPYRVGVLLKITAIETSSKENFCYVCKGHEPQVNQKTASILKTDDLWFGMFLSTGDRCETMNERGTSE